MELMTYRRGHHSTSDDAGRYRDSGQVKKMARQGLEPISRAKLLLKGAGTWDDQKDEARTCGCSKRGAPLGFLHICFWWKFKIRVFVLVIRSVYTNDGWLWWQSYCLALLVIVVACINVSQAFALVTSSSLGLIPAGAARRIPI